MATAQDRYAESIAMYFDKHLDEDVAPTVIQVSGDLDTWIDRHAAHKGGELWMSDADRAVVLGELRPRLLTAAEAGRAVSRASARVSDARRDGADEETRERVRDARHAAMETERAAHRESRAILVAALARHPENAQELRSIARRTGVDL